MVRLPVNLINLQQFRYYSHKVKSWLKDAEKKNPNKEVFGKRFREDEDTVEACIEDDLSTISAVPEDYRRREARVSQRPKNVMQQGTDNTRQWVLQFNTEQRWENPLMGWTSSGDSHSNTYMEFPDACSAVCYARKEGYNVDCGKAHVKKEIKKSYGENFSWNRRTRIFTNMNTCSS